MGLPETLFRMDALEYYGKVNYLKGGILFADYLTTVSPTYAHEIMTPEFGCGLDGVVRQRAERLVGILNGVDYAIWDPANDKLIAANYSAKKDHRQGSLQKGFAGAIWSAARPALWNGRAAAGRPRLADGGLQKGFDILAQGSGRDPDGRRRDGHARDRGSAV